MSLVINSIVKLKVLSINLKNKQFRLKQINKKPLQKLYLELAIFMHWFKKEKSMVQQDFQNYIILMNKIQKFHYKYYKI